MFIHLVLFEIKKSHLRLYYRDCKMWAAAAARHPGFLAYHTLVRQKERGQYASSYFWKTRAQHVCFMKRHHDRLVGLSKCPVKVLGYYNFSSRQSVTSPAV